MPERRYSDAEAAAIFLKAAETAEQVPVEPAPAEGLSLSALQEIAREAGIPPEAVARAALSLDQRGGAVSRTFLGLPIGVERTFALNRVLTETEWELLVVELREVFQAKGTMSSTGSFRQWTNGNLQALLEPTPTGHRLRFRTSKGAAQASMSSGILIATLGAVVSLSAALNGQFLTSVPGAVMLALAGGALFFNGAIRLPRWAQLRLKQMEEIGGRLTASSGPAIPPPTPGHSP